MSQIQSNPRNQLSSRNNEEKKWLYIDEALSRELYLMLALPKFIIEFILEDNVEMACCYINLEAQLEKILI